MKRKTPAAKLARAAIFSQDLRELSERFAERAVTLAEILEATKGRGFDLLLVLITLPFLTPIPLPGFSIPFGVVVGLIGAARAVGRPPWLPRRLLHRKLPPRFLAGVLRTAARIVRGLEFFLRPRLAFMNDNVVCRRIAGVMIAFCGLFLIAPLPVPFSNSLPAWGVLLLAAGALARDGLFFIAGVVAFAVTAAFFVLLAMGGAQALEKLRLLLTGG